MNKIDKASRATKKATTSSLLCLLLAEKRSHALGGLYHKIQVEFAYNSLHIEGSHLTSEQTRYIFETNTLFSQGATNVDDIIETANHFRAVDFVIENAALPLTQSFIKTLHFILKNGTNDSQKAYFAVGEYKKRPNQVGFVTTASPKSTPKAISKLLKAYYSKKAFDFENLVAFHHDFELIHPFQDGNGRVGRLILFKECLAHEVLPFIISDDKKAFYYRGLKEWENERGYLLDTCRAAQDDFAQWMKTFGVQE